MLSFMLSRSFGYCVCLLALISSASPVAAQDELSALPRSFPALQLTPEEQIELDGLLTESAWDRAEPAGEFIQQGRCCMIQLRREWGRFSNFSFRTPQRRISAYPARPSG